MAKRLDGKKVATGLLAAVALYWLGGLLSGSFDSEEGVDLGENGGLDPETVALNSGIDTNTPEPITPPPEAAPTPQPQPAPATQPAPAPAPAPTAGISQPAPAASTTPAPASGSLKPSGADEVTANWFKKLSPGAQAALASGVVGGASALLQGLAAKSAQEDAKEREDRMREDKVRRGGIPAFSINAFRSKGA